MRFTGALSSALVALAITSSAVAQAPEDALEERSVVLPLRRRHAGSRHGALDARDGSGAADMAAIERAMVHLERRYGNASAPEVAARAERAEKRWVNIVAAAEGAADSWEDTISALKNSAHGGVASSSSSSSGSSKAASSKSNAASAGKNRIAVKQDGPKVSAVAPLRDIVMSNNRELEFLAEIKIGTPAQSFWLDPDSGSADLWVKGADCTSSSCGGSSRTRYNQGKSSTYKDTPGSKKFSLQYGIGGVSGRLVRDNVRLGSVRMPGMTIGLADKVSSDFANDPADGILGLGYRAIASEHQKPFIVRAAEQNHLSRAIVSFAFGRRLSGTDGKSEMRVGAVNRALYSGRTSWYPVTQQAYWQFAFDSFGAVGKGGVQRSEGIIDTGTSLIAMPSEDADAFWADVPDSQFDEDSGTYTYPCSTQLNTLLRMPGGQSISLNEKDINLGTDGVGSPRCVGAIVAANTPGQTIFGLAFLKNIYTVLDFGQNRIGLATLKL